MDLGETLRMLGRPPVGSGDPLAALDRLIRSGQPLTETKVRDLVRKGLEPSETFVVFHGHQLVRHIMWDDPRFNGAAVYHAMAQVFPAALVKMPELNQFTLRLPPETRDEFLLFLARYPGVVSATLAELVLDGGANVDSKVGHAALYCAMIDPKKQEFALTLVLASRELAMPFTHRSFSGQLQSLPLYVALHQATPVVAREVANRLPLQVLEAMHQGVIDPQAKALLASVMRDRKSRPERVQNEGDTFILKPLTFRPLE